MAYTTYVLAYLIKLAEIVIIYCHVCVNRVQCTLLHNVMCSYLINNLTNLFFNRALRFFLIFTSFAQCNFDVCQNYVFKC